MVTDAEEVELMGCTTSERFLMNNNPWHTLTQRGYSAVDIERKIESWLLPPSDLMIRPPPTHIVGGEARAPAGIRSEVSEVRPRGRKDWGDELHHGRIGALPHGLVRGGGESSLNESCPCQEWEVLHARVGEVRAVAIQVSCHTPPLAF